MKRLAALLFAAVTLAVAGPRQDTPPPAADVPAKELAPIIRRDNSEVGLFDRLRARRNPAAIPAQWFVADPQEAPQPAPVPQPMPKGPRPTGYVPPPPAVAAKMHADAFKRHGNRMAQLTKASAPPAKFDCVELGWVPPIRDQGNCGSCYEVATADQATCAFIKAGYQKNDDTFKISDQYGLDCKEFGGCNGGWGAEVAADMIKNGFPAERYLDANGNKVSDYPGYTADPSRCQLKAGAKLWKPLDWGYATGDQSNRPATVAETKAALMQYGVLNIAFQATAAYQNAGTEPVRITGRSVNHETTLVGWDDSKGAWKTRGQWGTGLGDRGYVWMTYDSYIVETFWLSVPPVTPPDPGPGPTPDPTGGITVQIPPGTPPGTYTIGSNGGLSPADRAKLTQARNLIDEVLGGGPVPDDTPPAGFTADKRLPVKLVEGLQGRHPILARRLAADPESHPVVMKAIFRLMAKDTEGKKLLDEYNSQALPDGWLMKWMDWLIKEGNLKLILAILLPLFGL